MVEVLYFLRFALYREITCLGLATSTETKAHLGSNLLFLSSCPVQSPTISSRV